ncbi:MAG: ankyrin repeat domain-containing protein [Candidatus Babeliales bacterium]
MAASVYKRFTSLICITLFMSTLHAMEPQKPSASPFALRKKTEVRLPRDSSTYSGIEESDSEDSLTLPTSSSQSTKAQTTVWVPARMRKKASESSSSVSPEEKIDVTPTESPMLSPRPARQQQWVSPRLRRASLKEKSKFATLKKAKPVQEDKVQEEPDSAQLNRRSMDVLELSSGSVLQLDKEFHAKLKDLNPAFHAAIKKGDLEKASLLVRSGADVRSTDSSGQTALDYALNAKNLQLLYFLRDHGVSVPTVSLPTRLSIPGYKNNKKTLVMRPAKLDESSDEELAIISPALSPRAAPMSLQSPGGYDEPELSAVQDGDGYSMPDLGKARTSGLRLERSSDTIEYSDGSIIQLDKRYHTKLKGYKARFDKLTKKAQLDDKDFNELKALIRSGVDINAPNSDGVPPIVQAVLDNKWYLFKFLVKHGADVNKQGKRIEARSDNPTLKREVAQATALSEAARLGRVRYVQYLLSDDVKADPNLADGHGATPLMIAVLAIGDAAVTIARLLVNAGADVFAKNSRGQDALAFGGMFRAKENYLDYVDRKQQEALAGKASQSVVEGYVESVIEK